MKVTNVYPGTAAERAGLGVCDVIYSINGYLTEQRGNLAWIIANAAQNNQLRMSVKTAKDGQEHAITERTVDSHVRRIRQKLAALGADPVETVYGLGYRLREAL